MFLSDIPLGEDEYTIVRAPLVSDPRDGSLYRDWDNATEFVVVGAKVNPFQLAEKLQFEINAEREYSRTGMKFFGPPDDEALPQDTDRIEYNGDLYEVFGIPMMWTDFEGNADHVEFVGQLKKG